MLRASAVCETAGIPTVSLTCEGFIGQAKATSSGLGYRGGMPVAMVPGHPGVWSPEETRRHTLEVVLPNVIAALTEAVAEGVATAEPRAKDIVFRGSYSEVNEYFLKQEWSDGLPIVPPTQDRVDAFLAQTSLSPDEMLGVMLPDKRASTVRSVAVNGVMAGCRPEYMPILVALARAMADPVYGVEHSGNTPGADTLIILNGPIIKELGFNYTQGVMRDGFQPNTSIGRFWRLYNRNVAGFLPHKTDKATFGNTWRVVVAENEDVLAKIGWDPVSVDMGMKAGEDAVTITRFTGGDVLASVSGSTPEEILPYLANVMQRITSWQMMFSTSTGMGSLRPLLMLSPVLAETIAKAGWSKRDVQQYLFDHARVSAAEFEQMMRWFGRPPDWNLADDSKDGKIPVDLYAASEDPARMVPLVWEPEHFMVAVTGDPLRTNAYVFTHNGRLAFPVTKPIVR